MKIEEARELKPGDKVMCVELQAYALDAIDTLFEWEVVAVFGGPNVRVLMHDGGEGQQLVMYHNIASKVGAV